ncbi:MAG: thermonuclease family protein [Candidatus Omnitrophica bacterium]|nr:thermonuclease family protein [Candidatus Omnitrophota bacterium]
MHPNNSLLAFFLLAFSVSTPAFPAPTTVSEIQTYDELLHAIREVRTASQKRIDQAINQEKVREAWETGKLIDEHVLHHKERADYGEYVLLRLSSDLGRSQTELRFMLLFARAYPIYPAPNELTWAHYRELLSIHNEAQRKEIAERAVREKWGHKRIREEARRLQASEGLAEEKTATPGKPGAYRVVVAVDGPYKRELALDLGFSSFFRPEKFGRFKPGEIVTLEKGKVKKNHREFAGKDLFTYRAYVRHIVDGDTFYALIDLGFGFTTTQKLRLRGLDAPEIETAEGREAKEFLTTLLARPFPILIRTVKSDKYDRYLADVWVDETYVNQELIAHSLAVQVSE